MDEEVGADVSGHTSSRMSSRIEVIAQVSGRRYWSVEQKLTMLRDAFGPGGSVRSAMERHDITSGSLYTWRRNAMARMLLDRSAKTRPPVLQEPSGDRFAEVIIADPVMPALPTALPPSTPDIASKIAIELPGGIRPSVDGSIDAEALGRVLSVLQR